MPKPQTPKPARRIFTAADKLRILTAADACTERGQLVALLRHEGIYSSLLRAWRLAFRSSGEKGLSSRSPGRASSKTPDQLRLQQLQLENSRLQQKLDRAHKLIDLQKKVSELLGLALPSRGEL